MKRFKDTLNNSLDGDNTSSDKTYVEDLDNKLQNQKRLNQIEHDLYRYLNAIFIHAESKGLRSDFFEFVLQYRIKQFELRNDIVRADIVRSYLYPRIQEALQ